MGLWVLAVLTVSMYSSVTKSSKAIWGLEHEALIVRCPQGGGPLDHVEWYNSSTNESMSTQKSKGIVVSRDRLKFLPARMAHSGMYACVVTSPDLNMTEFMNVTIHRKTTGCNVPDHLMYKTVNGSAKNPKITCPTIFYYNWSAPVQWFKNCKALQGPKYRAHRAYLFINNVGRDDEGDYTCKFTHTENGTSYIVTATRSFTVEEKGFSVFPVIKFPAHNTTMEVEIGKPVNITCLACFGKGSQFLTKVLWQINERNVEMFDKERIQEEKEQNQSSSSAMDCLTSVLRITNVTDKDLSWKYDCLALSQRGMIRHTLQLREKQPSKACPSH